MAKTKSAGASRLGRDSLPKYLGIKVSAGQVVKPGVIIIRQRGTKFLPGKNVRRANDDTLYAIAKGVVRFGKKCKMGFDKSRKTVKVVNVET